jgi:carotenoid cleavage dioxygenase-like enzyme
MVARRASVFFSLAAVAVAGGDDGYELLYKSAADEFENRCVEVETPIPSWAQGDFVIPSVGRFEMGERKFVGVLDAFGKLQRFKLEGHRVCATYRLMQTQFYNDSKKEESIAAGMLFYETDPPRHCPHLNPECQIFGAANDNNYVNTMKIGNKMVSLTDAPTFMSFDKESLLVEGKHVWTRGDLHLPKDEIAIGGTAHLLRHPVSGDAIGFESSHHLLDGKASVRVYSLSDGAASTRKLLNTVAMDTMPYMHSFGLSAKYAVLPRSPVDFRGFQTVLQNKPMHEAFPNLDLTKPGPNNGFYIVPLDGGKPIFKHLPADLPLYYTHVVNTYETEDAVIIDMCLMPVNPFSSPVMTMPYMLNKTRRNSDKGFGSIIVERFHLPLDPNAEVKRETLSEQGLQTDFTAINPAYRGSKHCIFWGVQWRTDPAVYGSMAIAKYDICAKDAPAAPLLWERPSWYPSEPTFLASADGSAEDAGLLVFTALDGEKEETRLIILDARTMKEVAAVGPFPRIGFTTHGEFYPAEKQASSVEFV